MATPHENDSDRLFLVEFFDGVTIVLPLADVAEIRWPEIEEASKGIFQSVTDGPGPRILVDMAKVRYCGSALLGLMVRVWKTVSPQGGSLAFCNVSEEVAEVLRQTRLDTLWTVYPSREAACDALQGPGAS